MTNIQPVQPASALPVTPQPTLQELLAALNIQGTVRPVHGDVTQRFLELQENCTCCTCGAAESDPLTRPHDVSADECLCDHDCLCPEDEEVVRTQTVDALVDLELTPGSQAPVSLRALLEPLVALAPSTRFEVKVSTALRGVVWSETGRVVLKGGVSSDEVRPHESARLDLQVTVGGRSLSRVLRNHAGEEIRLRVLTTRF